MSNLVKKEFLLRKEAIENPPDWANNYIEVWSHDYFKNEMLPFRTSVSCINKTSINIFKVIGTMHEKYQGMTWLQLLKDGKSINHNLERYEKNPSYYEVTTEYFTTEDSSISAIQYVTFNGLDYYVESGNHRTVIAKFHLERDQRCILDGVSVRQYIINHSFKSLFNDLKREIHLQHLNIQISMESKVIEKCKGLRWEEEQFLLSLKWIEWKECLNTIENIRLTYDEAKLKLQKLIKQRIEVEILKNHKQLSLWKKLIAKF